MKKLMVCLILLICISTVFSYDLKDYPEMFLVEHNGNIFLNAVIVVGDRADATDVIGATDIATSLNYNTGADNSRLNSVEVVLASEIRGMEKKKNLILVGGPCINTATAVVMDYPSNCAEGFYDGKAKIKLFDNNGFTALLIAGMNGEDTRLAAKVLSNDMYHFSGNEIEVAGSNIKDVVISALP